MSYLTSLEKRASFPLRPAEQEEVEVAEVKAPTVPGAPTLPGAGPVAALPPVSDMLPRTGEKEKYTFPMPEGPKDNPFDIAFGSRENLASLYAEVVDTTAKQRYEAGQLAEKYNFDDQEETGTIAGMAKEFLETAQGLPFLPDEPSDKKDVLERTAVDTYMLEADKDVSGLAQVVLGESAIDPNSEAAKKLKEQGRSAKKIRTAEDIRTDVINGRLRQGFITQAGDKDAGAQAYRNYVEGIIKRARDEGEEINFREAQGLIASTVLTKLPKEPNAVDPPLVTAQREAVNLVSAMTEKGLGRELTQGVMMAPFRYLAGGTQQLGDRLEPSRVFDPYVEEDAEMKLTDPLGARARGPVSGGEAERAQFLAQQMFTPVDFEYDEDQSLQTSLTAAQTINDLIRDGSLVLASTAGNFDDLYQVVRTPAELLGSEVVADDDEQNRFIALSVKAGLPVDKAYAISRAESRGNPAAFAFNLHLGQYNPNDPDNPRNRTAEQEATLRKAMQAAGLDVNLESRAAQNYYGEDARRALDLATAVNPVAAVQGGAFGEFQVTGKFGDALGYVKEKVPDVETDEQAALTFLGLFKKYPGMVSDDMFARWFQKNPEAQKSANEGDLDALAAQYYGALKDPEEEGISDEEARRRRQQMAVRDSWLSRVKEGSEAYLAGMTDSAREATQVVADAPETPTSDPKTLLAARGTREDDDYFTSAEYVQDRTQVEQELNLNAIEVETGVSTVMTMFSDMGEAPSPGSSAFIAAVEDVRNAKENDPQLYQVVYDNKDAPMGSGYRNVANFLFERKASERLGERSLSDLTKEEAKELRAEARQEAFRVVTSAQTENLWRASFYTSFDYLLGEDEADVFDAMMPRVEVMGRTKDGFVFRQEGNVMAGAAALDAPAVLGQSYNIGVVAGYTFPEIEQAYSEYTQGKRGAASLAFAVTGATAASVAGAFAAYIPFSDQVGIEFVNEVHRSGVQGVAERQNFVEVGLHSTSELFATAMEELLETEAGRETLEMLVNSGSLPLPYELTTPARRYVAMVDMARATGTAVGMLGGLVMAVGVPDATDFLMVPKALKTGKRAYQLVRDIDLTAEGVEALRQTGTFSRAIGLRPQMFEHGEARRTTIVQLAAALEDASAKDLNGASAEDVASVLQLVDDVLETSRRQDEADAVFRNDLTASIKVEVDNGAEEVLSFRAVTDTPSGEAARHAVDRRLSKDAHAVIRELIAQSKNSDDPRRVELALQLEQRLNDSQLRETVSLSPGQADAALKAAKEEASPENVFGFTKRLEILRDALLLIDPASDGMAIRKTVFQRRMGDSLERVGNTAVENLPDFVDPTLSKGLDHYGPVPKADLEADLAKARLSDDKKAQILSDRDALEAWHERFKAAVADNSILDPQVRGTLLGDFKAQKLGDRSYRVYKNSDNSRRGNLYRGIVRGVSGVAGDATNAAFGQNILTRAMQGVLAAADARGEAYKKFAVALVDKNKLKAVSDGMTAEEFLAGGARPLRMRRFRYAIQSGTVDGVMQIMLANPVMRRLIPKDAAAAYKATYAASASARMAKRQELLAQQKSPLDLARLLQKEELKKLTQRRAVAEGRGDQALVDSLTADIDAISSPQFFNKVSEWMDASIAEMRAAQAEGRAANLPTLDLPIGIDPAIVNRMDMPVAPLSATRKFFRERYSPAFGFKAEEEVQSRALTTDTRSRRSALERPERMANEVILDQMLRYMAGVDPTDSRVIAEGKVEDFLERRLRVRSIGTFDFESRQVELRAQLDDLSEQIAQNRFGKAVDDLLPRERAQVRSDAFNAVVPLMSQYEAILIFTRSKEELDALLEQARFIGPRFRGEEADPNVVLSTLFQDPEFQSRLAKVAEDAPSQATRADVESRLRPKRVRAKMQEAIHPSPQAEVTVQIFGEWLDSREDAVDALLTLLRVDEGADAVDETMGLYARAFREIEQSADASEYGRDIAAAAAALAKLFERNDVDEVLKSLASLEQTLSMVYLAVGQGDAGLRTIDQTVRGLIQFLNMAVEAPAGSAPSFFFSMFDNYRKLYRLDQSLEGYEGLTKFLDNLVYDEFVQAKAPSDLVVSDSNLRYLRDQALPLFGGYEELTDAQRADLVNSFIKEVDVALGSQKGSARAAYVDASSLYPKGTLTLDELLESGLTEAQKAKVRAGEMSFDDMVEIADASGQLVDDTRAVLSEIAAAVRRQSPGEPLKVELLAKPDPEGLGAAEYNSTTNTIRFFDGYFDVSTLIHEGAHAMTNRALNLAYLPAEEVPRNLRGAHADIEEISIELEYLRRQAEFAFAKEYPGQARFYGLTNQDEFIAEIFANQQFRQWLATVPAADEAAAGSVLTRIVEALRSLLSRVFDMDPDATDSILAHSLNVVNDLIDADVQFAPGYFAEGGDFQRSLQRVYEAQEGVDDFAARLRPKSATRETSLADRLQATAAPGVSRRVRRRGRKPKGETAATAVEAQATAEPTAPSLAAVAAAVAADVAKAEPVRRGRRVVSDVAPVDLSGVAQVDEALVEIPDSVVEAESAFGNSALLWSSLSSAMDSFLTGGGKDDALRAMGSISGKALGSHALEGLGNQVLGIMAEGLRGLKAEESSDFFVKFAKALDSTSRFDEPIRAAVRDRPDFLVTLAEVFSTQARGPLTRADVAAVEDLLLRNSIPADELSAQDLLKVNGKENKAALVADEAALSDEAVQTPAATKATLPAEVERSPALEEAIDGIVKATGSDEIRVLLTDLKDSDHGRNIETVLQAIDMIGPERLKNISLVIEPAEGQSAAKRMFDFTNETIRIYDDALKSGEFSSDVLSQLWQSLTRYVPDAEVKALKDEWIKERDAFMRAAPERFGRDMTPIGVFAPNEMRFLSFERWVADAARDMVIAEVAPAFANNPVLKVFVDVVTALVEALRLRGKKVGAMALEFLRKDSQKYQEMVRSGSVDTAIRQPTPEEYFGEQLKWQAFLDNPEARKAAREAKTFEDMAAIDELIEGAAEATVKVVETFLSERLRRRVLLSKEGFDLLQAEVIKDDVQRVLFSGVADRLQQLGVSALNKNTQQPLSRLEMMELFKEVRGKALESAAAEDTNLAALAKERQELEAVRARLVADDKRKTPEMIEVSKRINEIDGTISKALEDHDVSGGSLHERMLKITSEKGRRKAAQSILDNVVPIIAKFDESDAPMTLREVLAGVKDNDVVAEVRELLGIAGRRGDLTQFISEDGELVLIRTPGRSVLPEDDIYMQTLRAEAEGRPYDVDQQLEAEVDAILQLKPDMSAGEARQKAAAYLAEMREEIVQSRRARHERGAYDYEMFSSLYNDNSAPLAADARRTGLESGLSTKVDEVIAETPEAGTVPFKTTRKLADEFDVISFETTPGLEQAAFALSQAEILKKNPPKRPKRTKGESDEAFSARRIEQVATNQAAVITLVIDMFEGLRPYVALPAEITVKGKDISLKGILKGQDFSKLQVTDTKAFLKEYTRLIEDALKEQGVLEEAKTLAAAMQKNEFEDALVRARGEKVAEAAPAVEPAAVEPAAARVEEPAPAAVEEATEVVEEAAPAARVVDDVVEEAAPVPLSVQFPMPSVASQREADLQSIRKSIQEVEDTPDFVGKTALLVQLRKSEELGEVDPTTALLAATAASFRGNVSDAKKNYAARTFETIGQVEPRFLDENAAAEAAAPAVSRLVRDAEPKARPPGAKIRRPDFEQILFRNADDRVKKANAADQAQRRGEIDMQDYSAQLNKIMAGASDEDFIAYNLLREEVVSSPEQLKKFISRMDELNPSGNMSLDSTSPGRNAYFQVIEEFEAAAAEPKATPRPVVEPPKTTRSLPQAGEKHTPPTPAEARAETAAAPRNERGVPVEAPALKVEDLPKVDAVVKTYTDMGKTSPETLVEHAVARNIDPDDHATTSSLANAVGQADVKAVRVAEAVAGDVTPTPAVAPTAAAPVAPSTVAPRAAAAADITADEQKVIAAVDDMVEALAPENADKIGRRAARLQRLIEETDEVEEMTRQQIADYVFDDLDVGAREALANSGAIDDMVTDLRRIFRRNVKDVQYEAKRLRRTAESLKKLSEKLEGDEQDRALRAAARAEGRAVAMEEALDEIMKSDRLSEFEDLLDAEQKAGKERRKDARKAKRERLAVERQEREFEIIDEPSDDIQAEVLRGIDKPPVAVTKTDKDRKAVAAGRDGRREAVIGGMDRRVRARGDDDGRFLGGPPRPPGTPRTPRDRGLDKVPKDIKGMVYFTEESQAIVYAFKSADAETGLHEIAHVLRRNLRETDLKVSLDWVNSQLEAAGLEKVRLAYGVDSQVGNFVGRADSVHFAEEVFADGFTQYLREGVAPTNLLENVFKIMKDLLHNIIVAAKRQPTKIEISPEMYEVFDSIFGAKKSFTINDMPDAMMFLNVQDDLNNSIIRFGGRLETDLIYEDTVTDRFRQLEMSLDDYRRRMAASGQAGMVGKLAAKLATPESAVGGLGLGSRTSQYLDPVSSRVLSVEDRVLLNRFRRGEIDRKALPSRLLPEAEKSLRVVGESAVLAGSLAMKAARLMYGDDASRALRAMNAAQRVHATGGARETEEFSNGLSVLVNDITRRWGDSGSRAIDDVIAYLSGRSAQLLTGSERGKRLNATNVDAFEHFSRMIHDMLWRMDPDARVALTQAAEARLMDPARLTTQDDIRPLSGMWHGYTVRTRASAGEPAKNFEGQNILLSNDYIDLVGPEYAKGEKINIDSHLQDTLGALYYAVTGEALNDGARINGEALDLAALVVIHSGGATLKAADGSAVHLNQVLKAANMTAGEALVKGVNTEVNGVMVNVPGLLTSSIGKKRLAPVLFALGHAGFAAGMFDDAAKWGFGITGREYRAFMRYVTGQQGSMPLDEIEVAKSVINRFGVSAEFVINERRLGQYYIPKQARDALREQMNQASRQFAFGPNNLGVAQSVLGLYNSLLYSSMVFGAVVAKPFYRLASLIDLGLGATSMANARSGAAAIARAGLGSALALAYKGAPMASAERLAEAAGRVSDVGGKAKRAVLGGEDTAEVVSDFKQRLRDVAAERGDALGRVITDAASSAKYRPEVRPIMEARPDMVFVVNGRPYRASDLRRIFIRTGLYNNMFKSVKATYMAEGGSLSELWNEMRQRQGVDSPLVRMGDEFVAESSDAKKSWNITGAARSAGDLMLKHGLESADAWADLERTGLAVTFMELGYSPQTAARMVVEAVYDYRGSMTQADRSWYNRLTRPFFAFTKNAIHHVTNLMSSPIGRFYARSMAKLPFLSAEAATTVMYEFLIGPYGINTSAMNSSELNAYYDMRNFLEYGLGDQVDRGTLNQYREILPDDAKDISDKELMDYDFNGWTIRDGYNGYDNVPADVQVSVRALIASRSKLYAKGQYVYVTKIMQDEKLRQEFVKLGGEMAVRDMPNRRGQASYMYNRYPTIQVPLPILEASTKEAIRLGLNDSIYWMLPDNFVHSGMDEAGAMAATLLVLADEALNLLPGGEPFIGDVARARAVAAAAPLVDVRGYGSPLAADLAKAGMTIAGEDVPLFVELDPFVARILQGSMIPVANAEDLDDEDLGVLGQIGQVSPDMMNAAAQMMGQTLGVGIRDVEFPFDEVRAARVVVEGGQRKVEFIDKGRGVDREFVDPKNEALRKKPFLVGKSALFFKVTPLGMYNQALLQYRSTAQEDQMAAQQELRAATIRFITAQGRQVGMRTAGSDEDRTTKSIERAANKVFREYK